MRIRLVSHMRRTWLPVNSGKNYVLNSFSQQSVRCFQSTAMWRLSAESKDGGDPNNPYLKKYAGKLKKAAALKSTTASPSAPASPASVPAPTTTVNNNIKQRGSPATSKSPHPDSLPSSVKPLDSILQMDKIIDKDADAIEAIWNQYHATVKDGFVSGVMTSTFYKSLLDRAKLYPIFILPLPRHTGFEFFFMQFHGHQVYFTSLLELQSKQENARPLLVLSHYTELSESKGIVLMSGEIDTSSSLLSVREAQNLVYQLQLFYATGGAAKLNLVEKFNKKPSDFDYQELLEEIEKLG